MPPCERSVYTLADLTVWPGIAGGIEPPLRLAVFGDPVDHSVSPQMQNAALAAAGIHARYSRFHIHSEDLRAALALIAKWGFIGVNLTVPHKISALEMLDTLDSSAESLGAVNTVRVEPDGTLRGFNTDGPGFVRAVSADLRFELAGQRVLIFGAGGGAGRAIAAQCVAAECATVILVNRTIAKARQLAASLGTGPHAVQVRAWDDPGVAGALENVDLIVNASTVGLSDDGFDLPLIASALSTASVFDTVYRASGEPTKLVANALAAGRPAAGGLSLLLYQGALSFEHWFARPAPIEAMRAALTHH